MFNILSLFQWSGKAFTPTQQILICSPLSRNSALQSKSWRNTRKSSVKIPDVQNHVLPGLEGFDFLLTVRNLEQRLIRNKDGGNHLGTWENIFNTFSVFQRLAG